MVNSYKSIDSIEKKNLPKIPEEKKLQHEIYMNKIDQERNSVSKNKLNFIHEYISSKYTQNGSETNNTMVNNSSKTSSDSLTSTRTQRKKVTPKTNLFRETTSDYDLLKWSPNNRIHLPRLITDEAEFLQLVIDDDVDSVITFLDDHPGLNINCVNFQGISALRIAVKNRSAAMVEFLLKQPNIDIGDTIMHAIRDNNIIILVKLLDAQKSLCPGLEFAGCTHSADFVEHCTPLILAAQCGYYEIVSLLINRGHTIIRPHLPNCNCDDCKMSLKDDALRANIARLSSYRAVASPAYLVHVSPDPVGTAFQLARELADNAAAYRQFDMAYLQLSEDISTFAVDLIGCCRSSEEVEIILKQGGSGCYYFKLPRLLMAVDYKQKEFVAHPNTQQVLESYWIGDWFSWKSKSLIAKAFIILTRVFIAPLILFMCMVAPRHRLVKHFQIPLNKLITHAAAYSVFLALVFYISNQDKSHQKRGPPNTGAEGLLILYVCGYTWSTIRMFIIQGPRRFFNESWNLLGLIMLSLFGLTFTFWSAATDATKDENQMERKYWNQYDPILLAEGTFCLATIFAYFRLMLLCQLNYHLGPLQVSLGKMTNDIYKYLIVFAIIISAFAAGLARFYQYYDGMVYEDAANMKTVQVSSFTSLRDTLNTLFWALFCMTPLKSADVVVDNRSEPNKTQVNHHTYTERIGYFCFGCFEVISVIVVLNMLIATMSHTYQRVMDNVATEWTFGKTKVYLNYMSQTTLPSPYNLIPTALGMKSVIKWIQARFTRPKRDSDVEANLQHEYDVLISLLVQRYFKDKESVLLGSGNIQEELNMLRRDVTSIGVTLRKRPPILSN